MGYHFENAFDIAENIVVPEANDVIAPLLQDARPLGIESCSRVVLATINFDNEFQVKGDEIDNVVADRNLTLELNVVESSAAQFRPEQSFSIGGSFAEATREMPHKPCALTLPSPQRGEGFWQSFLVSLGLTIHMQGLAE